MAVQPAERWAAMVRIGFVVEGQTEKVFIESKAFRRWLEKKEMRLVDPVLSANGHGNMRRWAAMGESGWTMLLRKQTGDLDRIVVLADLDPSPAVPCITARKNLIDSEAADLVVVARKAIESWFLADTKAIARWTTDDSYYEAHPEATPGMPWDRFKEISRVKRGRSKVLFAMQLINEHGFDIARAAEHPECPTARYFVERVGALALS